jgi:hypothetical protein
LDSDDFVNLDGVETIGARRAAGMRRWILVLLTTLLVVANPLAALAQAPPTSPTTVGVEPGPEVEQLLFQPCSDVVATYLRPLSFVVRRSGPLDGSLTVWYTTSGAAQPGVHYEPLPGFVTFDPGSDTATVAIVPRAGPQAELVNLTLQVQSASAPVTFTSSAATIEFVSPWNQEAVECGYRFTADDWNRMQTVTVGEPLHALTLEQVVPPAVLPATGVFRVVSGFLPTGTELQPDGTFSGRATTPGSSLATIEACRPGPPRTCVTTELTVTVSPQTVQDFLRCPWPSLSSLAPAIWDFLRQVVPALATCS